MSKNSTTYTLKIDAELSALEKKLGSIKGSLANILNSP